MVVWILDGRTLGAHPGYIMVHIKYICFNLSVFLDILHQMWVEIMTGILETFL